jgi:hypothetical protein
MFQFCGGVGKCWLSRWRYRTICSSPPANAVICQELAYSRFAESSQGLLLWLDQSFALHLSHPSIVNIIIVVPPITACASSYDYQLLPQTHNLDIIDQWRCATRQ